MVRLVVASLALATLAVSAADDRRDRGAPATAQLPAATDGDAAPREEVPQRPRAFLVPVRLPLTGDKDTQIKRMIDQIVAQAEEDDRRPYLILEFQPEPGQTGEASQFDRALSLARYLVSDRVRRVRTVAYVPQTVRGHGVLAALACEEIIVAPDAELGEAGISESFVDSTVRESYRMIAELRRTVPAAVALGMLDPALEVFKVQTLDGVRYVLRPELDELQQQAAVSSVDTLSHAGDLALFTGREMRLEHGFASHLAASHQELAAALRIAPESLRDELSLDGEWHPVSVPLKGPITAKSIDWIQRSLQQKLDEGQVNFICLWIDSAGGSPVESLRLAQFLADLDPRRVRTVAFVAREARGDAWFPAVACDHLVVAPTAQLGGPGAVDLRGERLEDVTVALQALANAKQRSWSLPVAAVDSQLTVYRYTHQGTAEVLWLSPLELRERADADQWTQRERLDTIEGLRGEQALETRLARYPATSIGELAALYHLDGQFRSVEPNWAHLLIERLASPRVAGVLLFVAWFALMMELMTPGLTIAGFTSGLCFLLFFWSNYLHGTAGWLEFLLFAAGVTCVIIELFVTPGFGVFGVGGGLLVITSLVLASQTFVIPRNSYQLAQLPGSIFIVAGGFSGALVGLLLMRRYLPNAPLLNRLTLAPPTPEERQEMQRREMLSDWGELAGQQGRTVTRLAPSGKAKFGERVVNVISDGELLDAGTWIYVAEVQGNRVLVRPVEEPELGDAQ